MVKVRQIIKKEVEVTDLGGKLKKARKESGQSLTFLARSVGISRHYWYQIENNNVTDGVSVETLRKIEKALGVDFGVNFD